MKPYRFMIQTAAGLMFFLGIVALQISGVVNAVPAQAQAVTNTPTNTLAATAVPATPKPATTQIPGQPTVTVVPTSNPDDPNALEEILGALDDLLFKQEKRIEAAYKFEEETHARIPGFKEEGRDTWALEEALADYHFELLDVQAAHNAAVDTLKSHPGFDNNGKVMNRELAKRTVQSIKENWLYALGTLSQANKHLNLAIEKVKRQKTPTPNP